MSMRLLFLAATLAAAGACASAPRAEPGAPLAARLSVTASGMDVGLNDDAHVAVFAVSPGQGVELVYPRTHERTRYVAGWSTIAYNPAGRSASYEPRLARFLSSTASTVLVLVASRQPIDVRRFAAGVSLERALGTRVYRSYDADAVIGGIARLTVPDVPQQDWAMDVTALPVTRSGAGYALLDEGSYAAQSPYVTVYCNTPGATGRVLVHVEFARYACPPAEPGPPAPSDTTAADSVGTGPSAARAPVVRRTFADTEEGALGSAGANVERARREAVRDAARERARDAHRQPERIRTQRTHGDGAAAGRSREGARGVGDRERGTGARTPSGARRDP